MTRGGKGCRIDHAEMLTAISASHFTWLFRDLFQLDGPSHNHREYALATGAANSLVMGCEQRKLQRVESIETSSDVNRL